MVFKFEAPSLRTSVGTEMPSFGHNGEKTLVCVVVNAVWLNTPIEVSLRVGKASTVCVCTMESTYKYSSDNPSNRMTI